MQRGVYPRDDGTKEYVAQVGVSHSGPSLVIAALPDLQFRHIFSSNKANCDYWHNAQLTA